MFIKRIILLTVLAVTSLYSRTAIGVEFKKSILACPFIRQTPKIDGKLNDECWRKAAEIPCLLGMYSFKKAEPSTTVKLFTDGEKLYLSATIRGGRPVIKTKPKRDKLNWGDSLELFIAPGRVYYHIAFNPNGAIFDTIGRSSAFDHNYNSIEHAVKLTDNGWNLEAALPFKEFNLLNGVQRGDEMDFNVCRIDKNARPKGSCWSPTMGTFHNRRRLGTLIFGSYSEAAAKKFRTLAPKNVPASLNAEALSLKQAAEKVQTVTELREYFTQLKLFQRKVTASVFKSKKLVFWDCNPWDLPPEEYLPKGRNVNKVYHIEALQNEFASFALGVANHKDEPVRVRCVPTTMFNLNTGEVAKLEDFVSLRQVVKVGIRGGSTQRDALPEINLGSVIDLRPYSNAVVWLEVDTRKMPAGSWVFSLDFAPTVKREFRNRAYFRIDVSPLKLPETVEPYSIDWARLAWPPALHMLKACLQDRKDHYINTIMSSHDGREAGMRSLTFDKNGNLLNKPDLAALRGMLKQGTPQNLYVFGFNYGMLPKYMNPEKVDPKLALANFKKYVDALYEVVDEYNIPKDNFVWYLVDEPDYAGAKKAVVVAKMFKQARPDKYSTFVTFCVRANPEAIKLLVPHITLCIPKLYLSSSRRKLIEEMRAKSSRALGYEVLSRTHDPYFKYRLSPLLALKRGQIGAGFWNYCDTGSSFFSDAWDDYSSPFNRSHFTVIYNGSNEPIPSVRWEAWRQGLLDWKNILFLRKAIASTKPSALTKQAGALEKELLDKVFKSSDKTIADKFRFKIRNMLLKLSVAQQKLPSSVLKTRPDIFCLTGNARRVPNLDINGEISNGGPEFKFNDPKRGRNKLFDGFTNKNRSINYSSKILLLDFKHDYHFSWLLFYTAEMPGKVKREFKVYGRVDGKDWRPAKFTGEDSLPSGDLPFHLWRKYDFNNKIYRHLLLRTKQSGRKIIGELVLYGFKINP